MEIVVEPVMGVMTALVLAFILGLGLTLVRGEIVKHGFDEFRVIIVAMIEKILIPLLPIHIFGIFLNLTMSGDVGRVLGTFLVVVILTFALTLVYLIFEFVIAGGIAGKNPFRALWNMKEAYFTALGTSSSAATIPVTLQCAEKNGVSRAVRSFTVPLGATIHLSGPRLRSSVSRLRSCSSPARHEPRHLRTIYFHARHHDDRSSRRPRRCNRSRSRPAFHNAWI